MGVDFNLGKAGFEEEFADFGEGPKAPVVGKGAVHAATVGEDEVDVAGEVVGEDVEMSVLPFVSEGGDGISEGILGAGDFAGVLGAGHGFESAKGIEHEQAVGLERAVGGFEVLPQQVAGLEEEVGEVVCAGEVGEGTMHLEDVVLHQRDATAFLAERMNMMTQSPVERFWVDVDAEGEVFRMALHPVRAQQRSAAKILAQQTQLTLAVTAKNPAEKIYLMRDILHGGFVERVLVAGDGGFGFGCRSLLGHGGVYSGEGFKKRV